MEEVQCFVERRRLWHGRGVTKGLEDCRGASRLVQGSAESRGCDTSYNKVSKTLTKPLAAARKKDFPCATHRPWAITLIPPANSAMGFLSLPLELQLDIFSHWNVHDLFQMGAASHKTAMLATEYMSHQMDLAIHRFFKDVQSFRQMLRSCDAVVSGSSVLHILLPAKTTSWVPADLDIYVPYLHYHYLTVLLKDHGYHLVREGKVNVSRYAFSLIHTVATFTNGDQQIDIIVSKNAGGISPIFQFHSTIVMNFFSPDHFFCAYPALTLNHLVKVNPGPLYLGHFCCRTLDALLKYVQHGFCYTSCESGHLSKYTCKSVARSLTDGGSMWIDLINFPHVSMTPLDLFQCYGILDIDWLLGGMVCGSESAFVDACIDVVEDQLCVALWSCK